MEQKTYIDKIIEFAWYFGPKMLAAVVLFFIGLWIIKRLTRGFDQAGIELAKEGRRETV